MRRSYYPGNLSRMNDIAEELRGLDIAVPERDDKRSAMLFAHGSTAMDVTTTAEIQQRLAGMGDLGVVDMQRLRTQALVNDQMQPVMASMVDGSDGDANHTALINEATERDGPCCSTTNAAVEIQSIFPHAVSAAMEQDASGSAATTCSVTTPETERRSFGFIADADVDEAEMPRRLPPALTACIRASLTPKSPEPGKRSSLAATPRRVGAVPATTAAPSIVPRMTKAAALRLGIPVPEASTSRLSPRPLSRASINGREGALTPGTIKRSVTPPRSLAGPSIAPRETKASLLRQAGEATKASATPGKAYIRPPTKRRESCGTSERSAGFEGLPGFSKRPVLQAMSPAPRIHPRSTKASLLREEPAAGSINANASPFAQPKATMRRQSLSTAERAAHARVQTQTNVDRRRSLASLMAPSIQPRLNKASQLRGAEEQQLY